MRENAYCPETRSDRAPLCLPKPYSPSSSVLGTILRRAKHLGYLKSDRPTGPVVEAYQSWSHGHGMPMVLLYPHRGRSASVIYRLPDPGRALTPAAVDLIRRRVQHSLSPGMARHQIICRCGGEILGLDPTKAEAIAFWIADAALDPDQTGPLIP